MPLKIIKKIVIKENESQEIYLDNFNISETLDIDLDKGSSLKLCLLCEKEIGNYQINVNVNELASFSAYFADFSENFNDIKVNINLNEMGANCYWHLASLASSKDKKEFDVSIFHKSKKTHAISDNYGVCKDEGKLIFSGISEIQKGSVKSTTRQNARIMVFDDQSNGVAKPILKIDENDINASHGAVVGKINDEHLFYLTSRGLTDNEAKELITLGYLKPILNGFNDESYKTKIEDLIERKM